MKRHNHQTGVSSSKGASTLRNSNRSTREKIFSQALLGQTHFPERSIEVDGKPFRIRCLGGINNIETAKERAEVAVEVAMKNARRTTLYKIKRVLGDLHGRKSIDVDLVSQGTPEEIVETLFEDVGMGTMLKAAKSIYSEDK